MQCVLIALVIMIVITTSPSVAMHTMRAMVTRKPLISLVASIGTAGALGYRSTHLDATKLTPNPTQLRKAPRSYRRK